MYMHFKVQHLNVKIINKCHFIPTTNHPLISTLFSSDLHLVSLKLHPSLGRSPRFGSISNKISLWRLAFAIAMVVSLNHHYPWVTSSFFNRHTVRAPSSSYYLGAYGFMLFHSLILHYRSRVLNLTRWSFLIQVPCSPWCSGQSLS